MLQSRSSSIGIVLVVVLLALGWYSYYSHLQSASPPGSTSPDVSSGQGAVKGKIAPEIALQDLQGRTIRLSDYRGKVVVLNFWASWCPPCKAEMPEINQAASEFAQGNDAVLLTVNLTDGSRETETKARKYINDNNYSMTVLLDTGGNVANAYGITGIPTTFIIDKNGVIQYRFSGGTTKSALEGYVSQFK